MGTYKPHDRVAHRHSRRIDEVDGVPTTHTQHGWVHAWTVTDGPNSAAPLPFAARKSVPAVVAVPAMLAVTLIGLVASLAVITNGRADQARLIATGIGALVLFSLAAATPGLIRAAARATSERSGR